MAAAVRGALTRWWGAGAGGQAAGIFDTVTTRIVRHKQLLRQLEKRVEGGEAFDAALQRQFNRLLMVGASMRDAAPGVLLQIRRFLQHCRAQSLEQLEDRKRSAMAAHGAQTRAYQNAEELAASQLKAERKLVAKVAPYFDCRSTHDRAMLGRLLLLVECYVA